MKRPITPSLSKSGSAPFPLQMLFRILLLTGFAGLGTSLHAAHIIGGEINYECLGNDNYRFYMTIYRDCAGGGAPFDGLIGSPFTATITIYQGDNETPFTIIDPGAPTITPIPPDLSNPCLIAPPGICVEEGVYSFTVNLPYTGDSYHIVYQRCCRNNTISNIINPGNTGATYYMELTPKAQQVCNNSPIFDTFPPIVICKGEPIDFYFSATDPDGDELHYSFCKPYAGGGANLDFPNAPNGVAPNPDAAPPYSAVAFETNYTYFNPLGTSPPMSIDPNTGFITGIPEFQGQFVVGVCVEEYRNGELLSVTRRDFQFNVANCQPTIVAQIASDDIKPDGTFVLRACGTHTVTFDNQSYQTSYINETAWNFDLGNGDQLTSDEWEPTLVFPEEGTFSGTLILNPGTNCSDTAYLEVGIFPAIEADFSFDYDTCLSGPVNFTDLSVSQAGPGSLQAWNWDFGDGENSELQNPSHTYLNAGSIPVSLTVQDTNLCEDTRTKTLQYYPLPESIIEGLDPLTGCTPVSLTFDNLAPPINDAYEIFWDFGDGQSSEELSPDHTYETAGVYSVFVSVLSPAGCYKDSLFPDLIQALPSPVAGFDFTPKNPSNFEPLVQFTDQSQNAVSWYWNFNGLGESALQNPSFEFPDTGLQVVTQIVTHSSGCQDTLTKIVDVEPLVRYFLPNAFTPNGDGINDGFRGNGVMDGVREFTFQIWDRYGALLFETNDPFQAWDGRLPNKRLAPPGVYLVTVHYLEPRGKEVVLKGTLTLVY